MAAFDLIIDVHNYMLSPEETHNQVQCGADELKDGHASDKYWRSAVVLNQLKKLTQNHQHVDCCSVVLATFAEGFRRATTRENDARQHCVRQ